MTGNIPSLRQYSRYFLIGGVIGVASVLLLEALSRLLPTDTPVYYALAVGLVYMTGVLAGFTFHSRYTFVAQGEDQRRRRIAAFALISLLGALLTSVLSAVLRFALDMDLLIGKFASPAAFVAAALAASVLTYWLNARLVFGQKQQG